MAYRRRRPVARRRKRVTRTYRRKKRSSRRVMTTSETAQQLAVYRNPFSTKTQQPKIPDGSRNHSLGCSYRYHANLTAALPPGDTTGVGVGWTFILQPSRLSPGYYWMGPPETVSTTTGVSFLSHPDFADMKPADAGALQFGDDATLDAWRLVSAGLKIRDLSSNLKNSGYWQALRVRPGCWGEAAMNTKGIHAGLIIPDVAGWPNDPSYSSGTLKSIGSKDFFLAVEQDDHLWNEEHHLDKSHDFIVIFLQGGGEESLLIDLVQNLETSYNSVSLVNKYQTQCQHIMPGVLAKVQQAKRTKCKRAGS